MSSQGEAGIRQQRLRESISIAEAVLVVSADVRRFLSLVVESPDNDAALATLRDTYGFDELHGRAVLDMPVRHLSTRERARLIDVRDNFARELADIEHESR
jgi:DNA gyrase/topoisomerase IV subunit A